MSPAHANPAWLDEVARALGTRASGAERLSGGCVGDVFLARFDGPPHRCVVKLDASPSPGLAIEGRMLDYLAEHSTLPCPRVLHCTDGMLGMEFIETSGSLSAEGESEAARLLADLHAIEPEDKPTRYGLGFDTLIGGLHQPNAWSAGWPEFFADRRLREMARQAHEAGRLSGADRARIDALAARLDGLLPARPPSSLVHGDAWGGNVLCAGGRIAAFIDPAIYYGHAEVELAFITMFSTFGRRFFDAYDGLRPIEPGFWEERRELYNLYPLLVHARLFGGGYVGSVRRILDRFGV